MSYIGQIELTKKKPPRVTTDGRAWQDLYDTLNHLIDSVNSKTTTEMRRPGDLHNSIGDIRVFKDKTDSKYYMETMTEDGSARREMFISDKDSRSGDGFYSLAGKLEGGSGSSGSGDGRNIEQQLFEQIPWTGGIPNNVTTDADGKLVVDKVVGATVSNDNIIEANMVGSGKTWTIKPNQTTTDSDGRIVVDNVAGATVSNSNIVAANVIGSGKSFVTKPPVTFKQDGIPTSLTVGDLWYDTNDGNKLYIAESVGADAVTGGEWVATVDGTIATAQSTANTAETNAQTGITNAASAQSTANSALSTANGKNVSFYQDAVPTSVASGDMWFDTDDEYKMYRANAASVNTVVESGNGWYVVNAVPTLNAIAINASQITAGYMAVGRINTASIAAADINADRITAGTIVAARIATSSLTSANITASNINAGILSAAEINMDSGKARIETDGNATFGAGNFKIQNNGNVHIQGASDNTGVLYFHENNDSKDYTGNAFRMFHNSSGDVFKINYDGSNRFALSDGGNLEVQGTITFGDMSTSDCKFERASGNGIKAYFTDNGSFHPEASDVHDLGRTDAQWDDVHANDTVNFSDRNRKESIQTSTLGLNFVNALNPVSYVVKGRTRTHYGLIAQEVKDVLDSLSINTNNFAGYVDPSVNGDEGPLGLRYRQFIAPMIKAIQELKAEIEELKS